MHWPGTDERVGIEASAQTAGIAERRGLQIKRAFVEDVTFEHDFDVVTCYALMEHLEEPERIFRILPYLVKEGGILCIMVPAFDTWKQKWIWRYPERRWHMYSPPEHLNFFTEEYLRKRLAADFTCVRVKYTTGGMFVPFRGVPFMGRVMGALMDRVWNGCSLTNRWSIFDHMYCYFRRKTK